MQKLPVNGIIVPCNSLAVAGLSYNGMLKYYCLQLFFIVTFGKLVFILLVFFLFLLRLACPDQMVFGNPNSDLTL
jgi:hypothetical protein